jgi:hypothetical protein
MILSLNPSKEEIAEAIRIVIERMERQEHVSDTKQILSLLHRIEPKIDILAASFLDKRTT